MEQRRLGRDPPNRPSRSGIKSTKETVTRGEVRSAGRKEADQLCTGPEWDSTGSHPLLLPQAPQVGDRDLREEVPG